MTAFQRLQAAGVDAVIGASWDFTTNAILPLAAKHKLVLFNTSALKESLSLEASQGYGFVNAITAADEAKPLAQGSAFRIRSHSSVRIRTLCRAMNSASARYGSTLLLRDYYVARMRTAGRGGDRTVDCAPALTSPGVYVHRELERGIPWASHVPLPAAEIGLLRQRYFCKIERPVLSPRFRGVAAAHDDSHRARARR